MAPSPPDLVATLFCKIWTTAMLELTNLCTSLLLVCYCLSFGDFSQFISPFARSSPYFVIRDTKWHRNFTCNGFTKNTWTCSNVLLDWPLIWWFAMIWIELQTRQTDAVTTGQLLGLRRRGFVQLNTKIKFPPCTITLTEGEFVTLIEKILLDEDKTRASYPLELLHGMCWTLECILTPLTGPLLLWLGNLIYCIFDTENKAWNSAFWKHW